MNQNFKKHLEVSYSKAFEECARTGHKVGDLDAIFNSIAMGTFAELIVRECIDIAYEYDEPKLSGPGMIIGNRIEEHFGVES